MTELFKPASRADMLFVAPYIGSLTTLVFILVSLSLILFIDRGWMIVMGAILVIGTGFGIDWAATDHGKKAKQVFYQEDNLIVPIWIYTMNRKLAAYSKRNDYEWKHRFYRCWITVDGTTYQMYTFPRIPWITTVIGFADDSSRIFFMEILREVYRI